MPITLRDRTRDIDETQAANHHVICAAGQPCGAAQSPVGPAGDSVTEYSQRLESARKLETRAYQTKAEADFRAAAQALQGCSVENPQDMTLHRSLGYIYLEPLNEPELAYPHLEAVYRAAPEAPGWGDMLAKAAGRTGRVARQIQVLVEETQRNPTDPWSRLSLAQLFEKSARYTQAERWYLDAMRVAPKELWVNIDYAQFLKSCARLDEASKIAQKTLAEHPNSAAALALMGDINRANWNLTKAQAQYAQAMLVDPSYYSAKTGLGEIQRSRSAELSSKYFLFKGTDDFYQAGLFNNLSAPVTDHILLTGTFNTGWFNNDDTNFGNVTRFEEALEADDRLNSSLSLQAGASGFQVESTNKAGFNVGATWKPSQSAWIYGSYRFNDPVDDSIATVAQGFTQDVVGLAAGYQFTDRLGAKISASHAFYSDGNGRNFIHIEPTYVIWHAIQLSVGAEYEVIDYQMSVPTYSSPHWYQTFGPVVEIEPHIFSWLSVHARVEVPYVAEASRVGTTLNIGPAIHIADHLEGSAEYLYYYVPGSFTNYSGSGFRAALSYRF